MKLLMHTCCAPCSVYCIKTLRNEEIEPTLYWYNPNIHPYEEYKARRDTLKEYSKSINVNAIFEENYGLNEFCKNVIGDLNNRCINYCYKARLEKTAKYAKENGYDAITTTLLISPYQNHEALKEICGEICRNYGLEFIYRDFRVGFKEGQADARKLGLYMQKYCGCIFSSEIRYNKQINSDYNESIIQNKITEKKIRLNFEVLGLELRQHKNGNKDERMFIYNLKKEVYKKYIVNIFKEWNENIQLKLFEKFMKENSKNIELIYLNNELIGFYSGQLVNDKIYEIGNICIKPEYQNKGIGTAILKELIFENKNKDITLKCFKCNPAINLFERVGFNKTEENNTHYMMKYEKVFAIMN